MEGVEEIPTTTLGHCLVASQGLERGYAAEDTAYSEHRTWRTQTVIDLEASSMKTSSHGIGRFCASCQEGKAIDTSIPL